MEQFLDARKYSTLHCIYMYQVHWKRDSTFDNKSYANIILLLAVFYEETAECSTIIFILRSAVRLSFNCYKSRVVYSLIILQRYFKGTRTLHDLLLAHVNLFA